MATILSVQPRRGSVVDLTVRFYTREERPITGERKVDKPYSWPHLQPGMAVPVSYDPSQPERFSVDTRAGLSRRDAEPYAPPPGTHWVEAEAVVISAAPTGNIVIGCAEFEVRLGVTRPDGSRFDATIRTPVETPLLVKMIPGSILPIRFALGDEQHISFKDDHAGKDTRTMVESIRKVQFHTRRHDGYDVPTVDDFLDDLVTRLSGPPLPPDERDHLLGILKQPGFPVARKYGYATNEVEAFLSQLAEQL